MKSIKAAGASGFVLICLATGALADDQAKIQPDLCSLSADDVYVGCKPDKHNLALDKLNGEVQANCECTDLDGVESYSGPVACKIEVDSSMVDGSGYAKLSPADGKLSISCSAWVPLTF
jgi:hypothetical protein